MCEISPIDGRYIKYTEPLKKWFSEESMTYTKYLIELDYLNFLLKSNVPAFPYDPKLVNYINELKNLPTKEVFSSIVDIERRIHHDVKSIEYFIATKLKERDFDNYVNLVHFGLTSQDINTTAYSLSLKNCHEQVIYPTILNWVHQLKTLSNEWKNIVIVGRTHGQVGTWTSLGKEIYVFYDRMLSELYHVQDYQFKTKFGGSMGNSTSHSLLNENIDWQDKLSKFCMKTYQLARVNYSTQIHNYNEYAQYFDHLKRICGIALDFSMDIWLYCMNNILQLQKPKEHVGSSIMPHKINPIEFENAEGNLKITMMWLNFISTELLTSRLQRDLSDSTILRNIGTILGHFMIAINQLQKGMKWLTLNIPFIERELKENIHSMSEIENHLMRIENKENGYQTIKDSPQVTKSIEEYKQMVLNGLNQKNQN